MAVIFQLFGAEDLKQLTVGQINEIRRIVGRAVSDSGDPSLEASLLTSKLIQDKHMPRLLPRPRGTSSTYSEESTASPPISINISPQQVTEIPQDALDTLKKRVREVFHQLTSELPSGPSRSLTASKLTAAELLDQLLSPADLAKLTATGKQILAWALTCELANFKTYEALQSLKQRLEEKFMDFMEANGKGRQRPKGPDSLYSPFYPFSPLYDPDRSRPNP